MALGLAAALGLVFHGIATVVGKAWDASKDFISWIFGVLPRPLKFFFFLYMILFLVSIIMPKFLGAGFACDSVGNPYKINFIKLRGLEQYIDNLQAICGYGEEVEETAITELPTFTQMIKNFFIKLWTGVTSILTPPAYWSVYNAYAIGDINTTQQQLCDDYRAAVLSNQTVSRDFVLRTWGETVIQPGYKQVVHVGCSQNNDDEWYQTLHFFSIDIFNFEMWLMFGIIGALIPFMWKWYGWVHKR